MFTELTWEQLREDMKDCEQSPGQSVYEHGRSVWYNYKWNISEILAYGCDDERSQKTMAKNGWKYPDWFVKYDEELAWERLSDSIISDYTLYHDCGKPYCKIIDEKGRPHFPEHAKVSYQVWNAVNKDRPPSERGEHVAELIRRDMEIHTLKAKELDHFCRDNYKAITLLLVGLAEIHSNAEMFGGMNSISFKVKWKQIDRRGRAICKKLFGDK
jgi:hypothetical protein